MLTPNSPLPALVDLERLPPVYQFSDEEPEEAKVPLSQYVWILKRYRWRILSFIAAAVIATIIVSARLTPIYESTAIIDIDRQAPPAVVGQDSTHGALNDADQFLATQIKLVQSDSVLRPVDRRFHLRELEQQTTTEPRADDAPVSLKHLQVTRPPNTYLLLVSYRSADPQLAADAANAIAQSYLEHTFNIRLRSSARLSEFVEKQLDELKAKMERSSQALAGFERELNVINPEEKTNILSSRLLQLNVESSSAGAGGGRAVYARRTAAVSSEAGYYGPRVDCIRRRRGDFMRRGRSGSRIQPRDPAVEEPARSPVCRSTVHGPGFEDPGVDCAGADCAAAGARPGRAGALRDGRRRADLPDGGTA
jgi:capsular polysaccharide biosynthesis protein